MESFQNNGDWWIPGSSQKVSGEVRFDPTGEIILDLNQTLPANGEKPEELLRMEISKEYPRIYGDLGQDGPVTVQNATQISANFGGGNESEKYVAERLMMGEHLPENPSYERADIFVEEIPEWTNSYTINPVLDTDKVEDNTELDDIEMVYAATSSKDFIADLQDACVRISNYSRVSSNTSSIEMETVGVIKIDADGEVELSTLLEYGNDVLEYLSFGIGTGIYPDKIQLHSSSSERPLDTYYTLIDYSENRASSRAEYLFRPGNIDFESSLQNWVNHREDAPEIHQNYRILLHRSNLSPQLKFLTAVIALEAFYDAKHPSETILPEERFREIQSDIMEMIPDDSDIQGQIYGLLKYVANKPSIKRKLIELMESEDKLFQVFFDIEDLASRARARRNEVAHGSIEATPAELHYLAVQLHLVIEGLIAREIGIPLDALPNALASRHQGIIDKSQFEESTDD